MNEESSIKPTDLRGILKYVPMFRGQTFVVALDGSVVAHENFRNLLLDLAVLRSLNINIVLVHGIGSQIEKISGQSDRDPVDFLGTGPTDEAGLSLALQATAEVSFSIISQLTELGLTCAVTNAVRGTEVGVIRGVDYLATGKVEKVDRAVFDRLIKEDIIPLVQPVAASRSGRLLRLNSDLVACALAEVLEATKLIYLTSFPGLTVGGETLINLAVEELEQILQSSKEQIHPQLASKAAYAVKALRGRTPRVHILDGRVFGAILTEVFDKVGLGTMIHSNEYQSIRTATASDLHGIHTLIRNAAATDALRERSLEVIANDLSQFFLYEIDGSMVACAALVPYPDRIYELAAVFVQPFYQGRGAGLRMVQYAEAEARKAGASRLIALSTQSFSFFKEACGFEEGTVDDLPANRRDGYLLEKRNPRILVKTLEPAAR